MFTVLLQYKYWNVIIGSKDYFWMVDDGINACCSTILNINKNQTYNSQLPTYVYIFK